MLLQTTWFRRTTSLTFDETFFLNCGLQTVHDGWLDPRICAEGVAPLPIMLDYLLPLSLTGGENRPDRWKGEPHDGRLIAGPRLANSIVVGLPLVFCVSWWLFKRQGTLAAALGAGLVAFSPTMLAHAAMATTDSCFALFGLLGLAGIAWYFRRPSRGRFVVMTVAIAAAMTAKYSGVFLLPVVAIMFVLRAVAITHGEGPASWTQKVGYLVSRGAGVAVLVFFFWWGLHLFSFTGPLKNKSLENTPEWSPWVKIVGRGPLADEIMRVAHEKIRRPAPLDGVLFQYLHNKAGHGTFLAGQRSQTGWWYYFPCTFLLKSTPVELFLGIGLLILCLAGLRAPRRAWKSLEVDLQVLCLGTAIFSFLVMTSRINLGQRYILVLYPVLIVAGVDRLWACLAKSRYQNHKESSPRAEDSSGGNGFGIGSKSPRMAAGCAAMLLAGQAISCFSVAPHYLSYFNGLAGGPDRGWHYLVGSNFDWGQDLPSLRRELERLGCRRVALRYFGTADPKGYGVEADYIPHLTRPLDEYDTIAISVTPLQGLYAGSEDPFREFRQIEPTARAGEAIFLFDLARPEVKTAAERAMARYRAVRLSDGTTMGGLPAYRIETPAAVYVLEKAGGGLARMIDPDGRDWINFDHTPGSRARGEFRGFPNAVHEQGGNYFHAKNEATDSCSTKVEYAGSDRVTISAESADSLWACRYDFFPNHCTFTMTRMPADKRYWVLYEGTPGGQYDDTDWWMTSGSRQRRRLAEPHEGDIPAPEWIAFGDERLPRVLYLLHHEDDELPDRFYQMDRQMTVFGFGRQGIRKYLDRVPQRFTIGFLESTDHGEIAEALRKKE